MSIDDIRDWIAEIERLAGDPERQHSSEDALYGAFIRHVAEFGGEPMRGMAAEVLKTEELDFPRWCA